MGHTRRMFMKSSLFASAFSLVAAGCPSFSNVFSDISTYVGLGVTAVSGVVAILSGGGIVSTAAGVAITAVLALIKAGFADISAAVAEYENAAPADKATLEGKISTAIQAVVDQIQNFWNDLKIPDAKLASTVQGLLELIVGTLSAFLTKLPAAPAAPTVTARKLAVAPKMRTAKGFVKDYNNILAQNGYDRPPSKVAKAGGGNK